MRGDWNKTLTIEQEGNLLLDNQLISAGYNVTTASRSDDLAGIDRFVEDCETGETWRVQYKTDTKTASTGNLFVETISVSTTGAPGWAYTCKADVLFYFDWGRKQVFVLKPLHVHGYVDEWKSEYGEKKAYKQNEDYDTYGVPVPIERFREVKSSNDNFLFRERELGDLGHYD